MTQASRRAVTASKGHDGHYQTKDEGVGNASTDEQISGFGFVKTRLPEDGVILCLGPIARISRPS